MRTIRRCCVPVLALALGVACASAPSQTGKTSAAPAAAQSPYDFKGEGKIPPVTESSARIETDVEEMPVTRESLDVSEAEAPPVDSTRAAAPGDSLVPGFRIQVLATSDREVAENERTLAQARLRLPGYLELEGGVYKVRVGDFTTRAEAEQSLESVRREHYADAWIVASRVIAPRPSGR